ncbi:TolB family protein [Eudoraea sp.]|uniref:TolB family protein n=1 Tax=Eudoraea sp. TaxID=1979955 RepID=UPI003C737CF4
MNTLILYRLTISSFLMLLSLSLCAQKTKSSPAHSELIKESNKRIKDYQDLSAMGYNDIQIFQDLGNVNFLVENFEAAVFWYTKLMQVSENGVIGPGYYERYQYALEQTNPTTSSSSLPPGKDWWASIKEDYEKRGKSYRELPFGALEAASIDKGSKKSDAIPTHGDLTELDFADEEFNNPAYGKMDPFENVMETAMSITEDGKTAYFSKGIYIEPKFGIFSKKQLVHKIYEAKKVKGKWTQIREIALAPKYYSSLNPTISADGKRLFFASDMPGTFGNYDIYVTDRKKDGSFGIAKNLGEKVNTKKDDLYPNLANGNLLFFASNGRKGHGGLDVYMVQVDQKKVGKSVNLGAPINSAQDDFSIILKTDKNTGYVMTNRGKDNQKLHKVAFTINPKKEKVLDEQRNREIFNAIHGDIQIDYSNTVFEDQ